MSEMSGKMIENKPLYVAVAQRKEDRKARLQVCFLKYALDKLFFCLYISHFKQFDPSMLSESDMSVYSFHP